MHCSRCSHENRAGARFCEQCATPLTPRCRRCGAELSVTARFCPECAHPTGAAAPSPPMPRFASPDSYTPRYLAERILNSRAALEGERKHVTVLFADMKGSMELLADRDPEEARQILDPILSLMMDAVHRYEGTVNQVLGDGVMAIFGAPVAHEDHAVRACYAALTMLSAVGRANDELRRQHGVEVQIRVGLNSGEVVVRSIGNDLHMEYSAVGQTTHLAARMEQLATPGTIRLTADTARLAEGFVQLDALGALNVKGLAGPVEIFELAAAAPSRGRLQAAVARGLTPFVGRQSELTSLEGALRTAAGGAGQLVAIVGEPGVGKSRLYWEFTHSPRTTGWLVLESSSVSYGKATAWGPLIDLLHRYFGIEENDDARRILEKVAGKLLTLDEALRPSVTPIAALLGLAVGDTGWHKLEPRERRQETLDAMKRVILRESQLTPVLLVFEDLHWIDAETQAFLDALVPSVASACILILVNYRPEYVHSWTNQRHYAQLRIGALGPDVARTLLDELLGVDASVAALKGLLIERTEGNPFFLEESVRSLVETGHLAGKRGAYELARPAESMAVPATVRAVLDARIDRLSPDDKRLLQTAAVIGKDVPFKLLEAVDGRASHDLHAALNRLATAEMLLEARLFPELELSFRHAITHEVTYGSLLAERRRELHGMVLDALLRGISAPAEPLPQLAHHAYRGGRWVEALEFLRRVAAVSLNRSANEEAVLTLERAVEALGHIGAGSGREALEVDVRLELRAALFRVGRHAEVAGQLSRAQALGEMLGDAARMARIHADWATHYGALGDDPRFEMSALSALEHARKAGDTALELTATFHLAQLYARTAQYARAAALTQRLVDAADTATPGATGLSSPQLIVARLWLLWCLAELGRFDEGLRRAETLMQQVTEPFERLTTQLGLGLLQLRRGHLPEAIVTLEAALPLCRTPSLAVWFPAVASPLGYACSLNGRTADGLALLEQAVEATSQRGAVHPLRMAHLAEAHLLAGDVDTARDLARRATDAARARGERAHEAYALRVLGGSASSPSEAETMLQRAVDLADVLEMRPLAGQARVDLAARYAEQGKRSESDAVAAAAARLFDALGMREWRGGSPVSDRTSRP